MTNEITQTPVMWAIDHVERTCTLLMNKQITPTEYYETLHDILEKSKYMEKCELESEYERGYIGGYLDSYTKMVSENLTKEV